MRLRPPGCPGDVPEVSREGSRGRPRFPGGGRGPQGSSEVPQQFFTDFAVFLNFECVFLLEGCAAGGGGDPLGFKQFQGGPKGSSWPRGGPSIFSASILN